MNLDSLRDLTELVRKFADDREWVRFHSPRNLATALVVEAAELIEPFQWRLDAPGADVMPVSKEAIEGEMADVAMYLLRLADVLDVDLGEAIERKHRVNQERWSANPGNGAWVDRARPY